MRRGIVVAVIVFSLLCPVISISCDATQETEAEAVIGPNGGVIEVTDPESPAYGVSMEIPEGALEKSAVVSISVESDVPVLPDGFNTGATALELDVSAELLHAVEIEFPVDYMPTPMEGLPCAFFYDEIAGKWRLTLPSDIDYDNMVMKIRTSHLSIWKWGWTIIDTLTDGAVSEAIQDALIEAIGEDRWNTLIGSAESLAEDIIDLAEEITTDAACATIEGIGIALYSALEFLDSELQYLYEDPVGLCDDKLVWCGPMSYYFFEHIPQRLVELFTEVTVHRVCQAIGGKTAVLTAAKTLSLGLALAYSPCVICYISLSELNPTFWGLLGSYYVAAFGVVMAGAALDDLGCDDILSEAAANSEAENVKYWSMAYFAEYGFWPDSSDDLVTAGFISSGMLRAEYTFDEYGWLISATPNPVDGWTGITFQLGVAGPVGNHGKWVKL